jgi:hypothetical protein
MHMGEAALIVALNAWSSAKDRDILTLRTDLLATQVGVSGAFTQAQEAVQHIVDAFRDEAHAMRQTTFYEAQQSVSRLELVVAEARSKFDEQDARFTAGLVELAGRLQSADAWAQAEPARVAALMQAAPVPAVPAWMLAPPSWLTAPPGMTTPPRAEHPAGRLSLSPLLLAAMSPGRAAPQLQPSRQQQAWEVARDAENAAAAQAAAAATQPQPQPQHQQPPLQPDPWAQFRGTAPAAAPASWLSPAAPPPLHFNMATPAGGGGGKGDGGKGGLPRELRINTRDWGSSHKLDVTTTFEGFQVWRDRATMFLSKERPDVRALLAWAETQSKEDLEAHLAQNAGRLGVDDLMAIEYAIHDGIKAIVVDGLLGRARNCAGRGCELWRALVAEWSGDAPQMRDAKARRCLDPPRCKDIAELWARLPAWERLGEEVETSGFVLPEWMRRSALEKLLPTQLLNTLIARSELKTYSVRLAWVKTQMEHSRGVAQAAAYGPGTGKDASGDVYMNSVEAAAPAEHAEVLAWALANAVEQGDWAQQEALQTALLALKGSKGKGKGKGKPGGKDRAAAAGPQKFDGICNHCHIWGHRRSECRRLDAELAKAGGGGKAKGKGKGGPKGGKGPPADPLAEVAAAGDDDWAGELAEGFGDEWQFADAIASLAPWEEVPARATKRGRRTWRPFGAAAGLNSLIDDATFLGAVAGETRTGGRVVEAVVDSGAVHSVAPPGLFPGRVSPSPWSRAGRGYRAANGTAIKNLGQVDVPFATVEGHRCKIPFQVAEVEQPLLSVAHLTSAGNLVELGHTSGLVKNITTGRTIALERRGGVYILKMFIPDPVAALPFRRQGA